jgi:uncharacterized protein (TIGR04255 family)
MVDTVFPEVDRVVYRKSPLVDVICQVCFPADLRIDTESPVNFQQKVRQHFPLLKQNSRAVFTGVPKELASAFESMMPSTPASTSWNFSTKDNLQTLEVSKANLTLVSREYRRWEQFFEQFELAWSAFAEIYAPAFATRIGLRYRNLIVRSKLGNDKSSWSKLLKPHILAEIAESGIEDRTLESFRSLLLSMPEKSAKVRLQHGFAEVEGSSETAYLIDCDFFVEQTELADVKSTIEYFHSNAARYFRGCITDELHEFMEPQLVSHS